MLKSFRNLTKSRYGLIAVFIFLGIVALAFAASDVTGITSNITGTRGETVATVGGEKITDREVRERIDRFIRDSQAQGQPITMEQFLAQGGLEFVVNELIDATALSQFGQDAGMKVSKRLIDGEIASAPIFMGIDGKFDQKAFDAWLAQRRISLPTLYDEQMRQRYATWLVAPSVANFAPAGLALPYASLSLERRRGVVGLVSTIAMDPGADPDDKTLTAYYTKNSNRYMVPQRRVIRYAPVSLDDLRAASVPSEAEIAEAYRKAGDRFAATEKRTVRQLVLADQAAATRVAGEVKGGKSLTDAASAAGLSATAFTAVDKTELAKQTSQPIADAAFAAAEGGVVGPVRSPLGWHVLHVEKVENIAAKSLDQARSELATELAQAKTVQALVDRRQAIEDGIAEGKTFDELVRDSKLAAQRTRALTASGADPNDPAFKPDPALAPIVQAGFTFDQSGDEPQVVPTSQEGAFALVALERVVPAAPRPLAEIRDKVKTDYLVDEALKKARAAAAAMLPKLEKGMSMQQALAEAGVTKGPPPKPFDFKRSELPGKENFIQMAFAMPPKKARLIEAADRKGYYVVYLDSVEQHDASNDAILLAQVRAGLGRQMGSEYASQFVRAIRTALNVKRDDAAIARLREQLSRQGTAGN